MWFLQVCFLLGVSFAFARVVELPNGKLQGALVDNYYSYTNIPYADPPVRFEPSRPYEKSWSGIRNATSNIIKCIEFGKRTNVSEGQEDCLILNVFTPTTTFDKGPLPVLIFIHGGAFMFASSSFYSPELIMARENMIVVTLNYRLGPLGFLSTDDGIIQGNLGLKDQLLALRWIKQNIHLFGGDTERILLTGQSAGGASVHLHILRKEAEDLVTAAVSISGTSLNPWALQRDRTGNTEKLAALLNCPTYGEEIKKCLQNRSTDEIHRAVLQMQSFLDFPFNVFAPVIESGAIPDAFITEDPRSLIQKGNFANIPWMATFTTEEGAYNAGSLLAKNDRGMDFIEELNQRWLQLAPYMLFYSNDPSEEISKRSQFLRKIYMGEESFSRDSYQRLQKMFSDVLFIDGIRETIQLHRLHGRFPVYGYVYGNSHNYGVGNFLAQNLDYEFGAAHGDDEGLLLPLTISTNYTGGIYDKTISNLLIQMFESFILNGTPSFGQVLLPENGRTDEPMQYLQILGKGYCLGPWERFSYITRWCEKCYCLKYESSNDKIT